MDEVWQRRALTSASVPEVGAHFGEPAPLRSAGRIQLLDPQTINQIAAGEVIERPASVVKELVENALDAGANQIQIDLVAAGRIRLVVRDNGEGMEPRDLTACWQRHATSKIRRALDLHRVTTLGFRGEAIPSIASVSRMTIESGRGDGARLRMRVEHGRSAGEAEPCAGPRGTTVTVENLLASVPARLKFLRSDRSELSACLEVVSRLAVAMPEVALVLRHAPEADAPWTEAIRTSGRGDLRETLASLWGRDLVRGLIPCDEQEDRVRVRGLIAPPHLTRGVRGTQWVMVNGRVVQSRALLQAVDVAYRGLTPERRYPPVMLHLDVPAADVDVNVSPSKTEVRFRDERAVFDAVRRAIRRCLLAAGMVPEADGIARADAALQALRQTSLGSTFATGSVGQSGWNRDSSTGAQPPLSPQDLSQIDSSIRGSSLSDVGFRNAGSEDFNGRTSTRPDVTDPPNEVTRRQGPTCSSEMALGIPWKQALREARVLGQFDRLAVVAEWRGQLLLVDQHAAHERILTERLHRYRTQPSPVAPGDTETGASGAARVGQIPRQPLLEPAILELGAVRRSRVEAWLPFLPAAGFLCEPFGRGEILVREVPADFRPLAPVGGRLARSEPGLAAVTGAGGARRHAPSAGRKVSPDRALETLRELLDTWAELPEGAVPDIRPEDVVIRASCKLAIKAGDGLGLPEMQHLLAELADCEVPDLCPHGRPITVRLTREDLARRFGR